MAKNKFDAIAEACMTLSVSASTVEERDTFLDFARKWKMAGEAKESPAADGEKDWTLVSSTEGAIN